MPLRLALLVSALALVAPAIAQTPAPNANVSAAQVELDSAITAYQERRFGDALSQAENLSARGNGRAATLAGLIYERGLTGTPAPIQAVRLYRRGVSAGDTDAMMGLARMGVARVGGSSPAEALTVLQRAVGLGRNDAAALLGDLFLSGAAGPRDTNRAATLYARAATAGDGDAAYAAGVLYADGDPDPIDDPLKAIRFLKQAAEAGRADASADYGLMLYQGRGVARDVVSAANWFKIAAEKGDADGCFYWALVNARGEGTPRDLQTALRFARQARGSSPDADRLLAQLEQATALPQVASPTPASVPASPPATKARPKR
jgi:uncharacterized protein